MRELEFYLMEIAEELRRIRKIMEKNQKKKAAGLLEGSEEQAIKRESGFEPKEEEIAMTETAVESTVPNIARRIVNIAEIPSITEGSR